MSNAYLQLGNLFLKNNQSQKAVKVFKLFIEDSPEDFRGYFNLGKALCCNTDSNQILDAINNFERALSLNHNISDAHTSIAALYIKVGKPELAVSHSRAGLELDGKNYNCMFNLNIALRQLGRLYDAVQFTRNQISSMRQVPAISECIYDMSTTRPGQTCSATREEYCNASSLTVVLLKWGTKYGQEYVSSLARSLKKHLKYTPCTVVCFTDDINSIVPTAGDDDLTYRLLPDLNSEGWTGWWYKAYLFSEESGLRGPVLYLDLDTIICSSADFLAETTVSSMRMLSAPPISCLSSNPTQSLHVAEKKSTCVHPEGSADSSSDDLFFFSCLKASDITNEGRSCGINSSIMMWNASSKACHCNFIHFLYKYLKENYGEITRVMYKFDHFLEIMLADMEGKFRGVMFLQDAFPGKIIDYQGAEELFGGEGGTEVGDNPASVVCFPLHPKPHHLLDHAWVRRYWTINS